MYFNFNIFLSVLSLFGYLFLAIGSLFGYVFIVMWIDESYGDECAILFLIISVPLILATLSSIQ